MQCNYFYNYSTCPYSAAVVPTTAEEFAAWHPPFFGGLVGTGLHAALKEFMLMTRNLADARSEELAAGRLSTAWSLATGDYSIAHQLGQNYLAAGLAELSTRRQGEADDYLNAANALHLGVTLASLVYLAAAFLFVYRPLVRSLDRDIKRVRLLLLLVPDDIARAVPEIATISRALLADAGQTAASAAVAH